MRKTFFVTGFLVLILGLSVGGALAYTFNDTTDVQEWRNGAAYGAWKDVIGNANLFDTFGADLGGGILTIYTNWNPDKDGSVNPLVKTADLFIDKGNDGSWDIAVQLDTLTNVGKVYANPAYKTSDDIFKGTGLIYGGKYDQKNPKLVPTQVISADTGLTSVVWTYGSGGLNNQVSIDLAAIGISGPFSFVWGTATCGNDTLSPAPIPGSLLLLGSGILGIIGLRRKL